MIGRMRMSVLLLFATAGLSGAATPAAPPDKTPLGAITFTLDGEPAPPPSAEVCGFSLVARDEGPQIAVMRNPAQWVAAVKRGEQASLSMAVTAAGAWTVEARVQRTRGPAADIVLAAGTARTRQTLRASRPIEVRVEGEGAATVTLQTVGQADEAGVRWRDVTWIGDGRRVPVPLPKTPPPAKDAPPGLPGYRTTIKEALIEWDWRMQDGIDTQREGVPYAAAVRRTLDRTRKLIEYKGQPAGSTFDWRALLGGLEHVYRTTLRGASAEEWERLWRGVHHFRRTYALAGLADQVGPLVFAKQVPGAFSHQLTQYYGRYAKPGGGIFVLDRPGESMACRELTRGLEPGSCQHPEVAPDGKRVLFAYCSAPTAPRDTIRGHAGRYYHLYEVRDDGSGLRQMTDGAFDDFSPKVLPNGRIVFVSTRRGGWHRCGYPGCETYTLALAESDGSNPRPISRHETHEWDPAVLADGRVIYTRWDYVDRHAVFYEQLWSVRPDGSAPTAFYGNNTYNPVGLWEARPVPGSHKVMATAAAHHGMTAGSIVLVDADRGVDGPRPITRLTPDAPFPESECLLRPHWRAWAAPGKPPAEPVEARRWPGHCYRSPYPLSETQFLAAYSFDALVGEPKACPANMFGLYLVDAFGNKELLYRDLNIASLWPVPLRPRRMPPVLPAAGQDRGRQDSKVACPLPQHATSKGRTSDGETIGCHCRLSRRRNGSAPGHVELGFGLARPPATRKVGTGTSFSRTHSPAFQSAHRLSDVHTPGSMWESEKVVPVPSFRSSTRLHKPTRLLCLPPYLPSSTSSLLHVTFDEPAEFLRTSSDGATPTHCAAWVNPRCLSALVQHRTASRVKVPAGSLFEARPLNETSSTRSSSPTDATRDAENSSCAEGAFLLQDVYQSWPAVPAGTIRRLRIVQVLPKSTPGINRPRVGLANASPGRQVLGTVPVEADGSAYFRAPAGTAVAFQALDAHGQAVQTMRSVTYLRPGETAGCVGCHERRTTAPPPSAVPLAARRPASAIRPAPDGSRPLSYPLLVQPVLNKHCIRCHSGPKAPKGIRLTGEPAGHFTQSYHVLAARVPYSAWGRGGGRWQEVNSEPLARVDHFGARASKVMKMLLKGHNKVRLSADDIERLVTWMDTNALFYGTFDPAGQAKQQRGERIAGPGLE